MPPNTMTLKDLENFLSSRRSAPREGGGLSKAASALRRSEEERQAQRSVFNQPRAPEWQPDHMRPGGHALEAPMISPDDLFGTGIPTKIAMAIKGAAPLVGGLGVIKNKGGNWLSGSVEGALSGLKKRMDPELEGYARRGQNLMPHEASDVLPKIATNNFIDKQLTRYVKNEMATPEDPIRALAERGVLHVDPNTIPIRNLVHPSGEETRKLGVSEAAKRWENRSDRAIAFNPASDYQDFGHSNMTREHPWVAKLDPTTPMYRYNTGISTQDLGFDHLIDELSNALNPESGLPRHLLLDPKSIERVSVPQAVERVAKINEWRAAQKAEADAMRANNAATVLHKEYPEKGMKWVELKAGDSPNPEMEIKRVVGKNGEYFTVGKPGEKYPHTTFTEQEAIRASNRQVLQDALKYEGDTMGHCVGGYCDDVASGRSRIYSLRDAKGQPHVTIETRNAPEWLEPEQMEALAKGSSKKYYRAAQRDEYDDPVEFLRDNYPEAYKTFEQRPPSIVQIKGKANRAPNEEYLPFVQDFVKSGKWSDVGDLRNSGLQRAGWSQETLQELQKYGIEAPEYGTVDEINATLNALNKAKGFAQGGSVSKNNPLSIEQLSAIIGQLRQEHFNAA